MYKLYVIGGRQRSRSDGKPEWRLYEKGMILQIDPDTGRAETYVEYITPPEACAFEDDPSIVFKAGTVQGDILYACTQTEVLTYRLPHFEQQSYISLPCFNDIHHVRPSLEGNILIANTGLDMVLKVSPSGEVLREWDVLGEQPWQRFYRDVDYRKIVTTKPHKSHPNYVFYIGSDIWVTRFEQRDAVCLDRPEWRIEIGIERPHDGFVYGDSVYYTTVNGHIVIADLETKKMKEAIDLNAITDISDYHHTRPLGWCRGLQLIDNDHIIVGFSHLRVTKWRENVRWAKRQVGLSAGQRPTRIALYDIKHKKLCWEHTLEEYGMDAIFSLHLWKE